MASPSLSRRQLIKTIAGAGVGSAVFARALAAQAQQQGRVTPDMLREAEWIAGISLSDEQRQKTLDQMQRTLNKCAALRTVPVDYDVPPALTFNATPGDFASAAASISAALSESASPQRPQGDDDLAMLPVTELAALVRTRQVSSMELTGLYLARLARFDPALKCVVTRTEELAMKQAKLADREIAAGRYRGPLHGIPWGAKDLIAYPGYPTTWGAAPFREQTRTEKATVAARLDAAGSVLVAKLTLGALAWGDQWFGGMTRNPWNAEEGSSGSSAGSAAATVAGLVGFSLGSETLGSIVSPCTRCGASGLRPTFGRVSRHGCMALAWSMDKIGPICRSVEDCAIVFAAIAGHDGLDPTAQSRPFHWPPRRDLKQLTVGYFDDNQPELAVLKDLGVRLKQIELPDDIPAWALTVILDTEAGAVFDPLTRRGNDEGLNRWPPVFREAQFVTAVEYLRAQRVRTLLMRRMEEVMREVDLYVGGDDLTITNMTGHPTAVIPHGLIDRDGKKVPDSLTFTGRLFGEEDLLAVAHAYQQATGHHLHRPPLDELEAQKEKE